MTAIAPHITAFLRERLPVQRGASEHTCQSYAYAFQLLFYVSFLQLCVMQDLRDTMMHARGNTTG